MSLGQFASSPHKDHLPLQRELLRKNYSNKLQWNQEQAEEFKTTRRVLSNYFRKIRERRAILKISEITEIVAIMTIIALNYIREKGQSEQSVHSM